MPNKTENKEDEEAVRVTRSTVRRLGSIEREIAKTPKKGAKLLLNTINENSLDSNVEHKLNIDKNITSTSISSPRTIRRSTRRTSLLEESENTPSKSNVLNDSISNTIPRARRTSRRISDSGRSTPTSLEPNPLLIIKKLENEENLINLCSKPIILLKKTEITPTKKNINSPSKTKSPRPKRTQRLKTETNTTTNINLIEEITNISAIQNQPTAGKHYKYDIQDSSPEMLKNTEIKSPKLVKNDKNIKAYQEHAESINIKTTPKSDTKELLEHKVPTNNNNMQETPINSEITAFAQFPKSWTQSIRSNTLEKIDAINPADWKEKENCNKDNLVSNVTVRKRDNLNRKEENSSETDDEEERVVNPFIEDEAMEIDSCEEESSVDSETKNNEIEEIGIELGSKDTTDNDENDESMDSFVVSDDEQEELLDGEEYDLSMRKKQKKKSRIMIMSTDSNDSDTMLLNDSNQSEVFKTHMNISGKNSCDSNLCTPDSDKEKSDVFYRNSSLKMFTGIDSIKDDNKNLYNNNLSGIGTIDTNGNCPEPSARTDIMLSNKLQSPCLSSNKSLTSVEINNEMYSNKNADIDSEVIKSSKKSIISTANASVSESKKNKSITESQTECPGEHDEGFKENRISPSKARKSALNTSLNVENPNKFFTNELANSSRKVIEVESDENNEEEISEIEPQSNKYDDSDNSKKSFKKSNSNENISERGRTPRKSEDSLTIIDENFSNEDYVSQKKQSAKKSGKSGNRASLIEDFDISFKKSNRSIVNEEDSTKDKNINEKSEEIFLTEDFVEQKIKSPKKSRKSGRSTIEDFETSFTNSRQSIVNKENSTEDENINKKCIEILSTGDSKERKMNSSKNMRNSGIIGSTVEDFDTSFKKSNKTFSTENSEELIMESPKKSRKSSIIRSEVDDLNTSFKKSNKSIVNEENASTLSMEDCEEQKIKSKNSRNSGNLGYTIEDLNTSFKKSNNSILNEENSTKDENIHKKSNATLSKEDSEKHENKSAKKSRKSDNDVTMIEDVNSSFRKSNRSIVNNDNSSEDIYNDIVLKQDASDPEIKSVKKSRKSTNNEATIEDFDGSFEKSTRSIVNKVNVENETVASETADEQKRKFAKKLRKSVNTTIEELDASKESRSSILNEELDVYSKSSTNSFIIADVDPDVTLNKKNKRKKISMDFVEENLELIDVKESTNEREDSGMDNNCQANPNTPNKREQNKSISKEYTLQGVQFEISDDTIATVDQLNKSDSLTNKNPKIKKNILNKECNISLLNVSKISNDEFVDKNICVKNLIINTEEENLNDSNWISASDNEDNIVQKKNNKKPSSTKVSADDIQKRCEAILKAKEAAKKILRAQNKKEKKTKKEQKSSKNLDEDNINISENAELQDVENISKKILQKKFNKETRKEVPEENVEEIIPVQSKKQKQIIKNEVQSPKFQIFKTKTLDTNNEFKSNEYNLKRLPSDLLNTITKDHDDSKTTMVLKEKNKKHKLKVVNKVISNLNEDFGFDVASRTPPKKVKVENDFNVDELTPKTNISKSFRESPITPKEIYGFRISPKTPLHLKDKKNLKRKLIEIEKPTNVLPKPKWTSSGAFKVSKISQTEHNLLTEGATTDFIVSVLNPNTHLNINSLSTGVTNNPRDFKSLKLYNKNIPRISSKNNFKRMKTNLK